MSFNKHLICLAIACAALCGLLAATAAPAAASGWTSIYSSTVDNGSTYTFNTCFVRFNLYENSNSVHVNISSPNFLLENYTLSLGQTSYYNNLLKIYVAEINTTTGKIWVDIAKPSDSADVTPVPGGTRLTCDTPGLQALAGDTVLFPIAIQNNNNDDRTYTLSASSSTGWNMRFTSGTNGIYKVFVPAHQSKIVTLEARTSGATGVGEKKITASVDGLPIDLFVYITSINQSAAVSFDVSSKIASIGDKIYYSLKIKNLQSKENIYRLSASGLPANWYARYKSDAASQEDLAEVVLAPNAERNLVIEIVPPYSVSAGDYNFVASITTPEGSTLNKDLMLRLKSSVSMDMLVGKLAYDAKPGEAFNIDVSVQNTGNGAALTNVYLETKAPDGWTVQVTPNKTASLTAGKYQ
ncbi:MAG TPA: NEW3 domain-containing protein, partial [Methanocella sp.]